MPFRLKIDDKTYRSDDFTLVEAIRVEELSGETWLRMNPIYSASVCRAMMIVALTRDSDEKRATARVDALTVDEALDCIETVDDDLPDLYEDGLPKPEAGSGTDGLSGPSDDSVGHLP